MDSVPSEYLLTMRLLNSTGAGGDTGLRAAVVAPGLMGQGSALIGR